jgi:hypothetical protein
VTDQSASPPAHNAPEASAPEGLGALPVSREREILRQTSVALGGRVVTLWEESRERAHRPLLASVQDPPYHATVLDVESTLLRWKTPLAAGGRWLGCRLNEREWCVAPVRREPAAPPPGGIERRSRERITLELAGLCVGATTDLEAIAPVSGELGLADPVTVALASLKLSAERIGAEAHLEAGFRATLLDELAAVAGGLELSRRRGVSLEARIRGTEVELPFDAADIAQACVVLERPAARRRGVVLHLVGSAADATVTGDAYAYSYALRSLIRCAVTRAKPDAPPITVRLESLGEVVSVSVEEGAAPDRGSGVDQLAGAKRGLPDLPLLRRMIHETCGGRIDLRPLAHGGRAATVVVPSRAPSGPVGLAN